MSMVLWILHSFKSQFARGIRVGINKLVQLSGRKKEEARGKSADETEGREKQRRVEKN